MSETPQRWTLFQQAGAWYATTGNWCSGWTVPTVEVMPVSEHLELREAAETVLDVAAAVGAGPSEFAALRAALDGNSKADRDGGSHHSSEFERCGCCYGSAARHDDFCYLA